MTGARPSDILRQLEGPASTDRDLLARFVRERDQAAFKELVTRYGPVVLGVCRRVTAHPQDAEDAFQAVFLILARRAPSIRKPEVIGSWLHGVALRVARTARRSMLRRRTREIVVSVMPEQPAPATDNEPGLSPILDEELAALPAWYRDAILLCDLRGISREEAALALGVPLGTISSRLTNGRKKLAERLTKRGITLSAIAISTTFSASQATAVPTDLIAKTCNLVADWTAGGALPKPLAKLTDGGMTVRKIFMIGLFTTAAVVAGVVYAAQSEKQTSTIEPSNPLVAPAKLDSIEKNLPDEKLGEKSNAFANHPRMIEAIDVSIPWNSDGFKVCWNAQGNQLAIAGSKLGNPQEPNTLHPFIQTITYSPLKKRTLNSPRDQSRLIGFSPDGKNIITELRQYQLLSGFHKLDFWGEDKGSGGNNYSINRSLNLNAAESEGYAFSQDGKTFRTVAVERNTQTNEIIKLEVQEVDSISGRLLKSHLKVNAGVYALSPDGKWLAAIEKENTVVVYDVDRAVKISSYTIPGDVKVPVVPEDFDVKNPAWHPRLDQRASMVFSLDGHRLAVCRGIGARLSFQRTPTETAYGELLLSGGTGQTVVLNPETGKPLPSLEEADCLYPSYSLGQNSFSKDGRLFVVSGTRYDIKKQSILRTKDPKREFLMLQNPVSVITIWDTQTGKVLKSWENWHPYVAFNPVCPLLAVVEPNGMQTRIGFWDFSADAADKK